MRVVRYEIPIQGRVDTPIMANNMLKPGYLFETQLPNRKLYKLCWYIFFITCLQFLLSFGSDQFFPSDTFLRFYRELPKSLSTCLKIQFSILQMDKRIQSQIHIRKPIYNLLSSKNTAKPIISPTLPVSHPPLATTRPIHNLIINSLTLHHLATTSSWQLLAPRMSKYFI